VVDSLIIFAAATIAGAINSIAGGGTLISFPALLLIGRISIIANATSTIALWPGSFAAMVGFRQDLARIRRWLLLLVIPSVAGGITGAVLLLRTPVATFDRLVPFLILGATLLFTAQEAVSRLVAKRADETSRAWIVGSFFAQLAIGVYGGYFGAGIGILMLATLGLMGMRDLHEMNGLKNLLAVCINGVAAIYFAFSGKVIWGDAAIMLCGAILGGYLGARTAKRLGRKFVRYAVIMIGFGITIVMLLTRK
jgi:Predicted permeases